MSHLDRQVLRKLMFCFTPLIFHVVSFTFLPWPLTRLTIAIVFNVFNGPIFSGRDLDTWLRDYSLTWLRDYSKWQHISTKGIGVTCYSAYFAKKAKTYGNWATTCLGKNLDTTETGIWVLWALFDQNSNRRWEASFTSVLISFTCCFIKTLVLFPQFD